MSEICSATPPNAWPFAILYIGLPLALTVCWAIVRIVNHKLRPLSQGDACGHDSKTREGEVPPRG